MFFRGSQNSPFSQMRYKLESGSRKFLCSKCQKKTFVRYIDIENGNYLDDVYGRCDREMKCAYHLSPYSDDRYKSNYCKTNKPIRAVETVFFDNKMFGATLSPERYSNNVFIQNLLLNVQYPFDSNDVKSVVEMYYLGTVNKGYMSGAITFPFIDKNNNIRAVQVKQFDKWNHTIKTNFLHSMLKHHYDIEAKSYPQWLSDYLNQDKLVTCLFGEHLLTEYPNNPIALVEAPKTAIYGTLYFGFPKDKPTNLIWLSVYNLSSFSLDKLKILEGRDILVFPDLSKDGGTFNNWKAKADSYSKILKNTRFVFSDLLEKYASQSDKEKGCDIADILIKHDWRLFR